MSPNSDIPALLHGRHGVPTEAEDYIRAHGIERIACRLLEELYREREKVDNQRRESRVPEHHKQWAYLLQAYCRKHDYAAPAELMKLTFEVLDLAERKPAPELLQELELPAGIRDHVRFLEASRRDGEADAAESSLSVKALASDLGVSRDTIRRWRQHPQYRSRRAFAAQSIRYWQDLYSREHPTK